MGFHTFPIDRADNLEDPSRYRFCSREELLSLLDPGSDYAVADLGSGTGFFTDDVAPFVETAYAVDVQAEMHDFYREKDAPENVEFVTADVSSLPFDDDHLDGAYSVVTHHEYATDDAMAELARVLRPGARLVTVDWSSDGTGDDGPSLDERFGLGETVDQLERAGFTVVSARNRPETFAVVARR